MQTVSRVINDHPHVTLATRTRVKAALAELGYRPNPTARNLRTGRSRLIGVVTPGLDGAELGLTQLLAGVEAGAAATGYQVIIACAESASGHDIQRAVERVLQHPVEGLVLLTDPGQGGPTPAADVPTVALGGQRSDLELASRRGARLAVRHLLDAGHDQVWHIGGTDVSWAAAAREAGWRDELEAAGISPPPVLIGDLTAQSGAAAAAVLAADPDVTAVFAANDDVAVGAITGFRNAGRRIPEDVSIVGFGGSPLSAFSVPSLTTVAYDYQGAGRRVISVLQVLLDPHREPTHSPFDLTDPPALVDRRSTTSARARDSR